MWMPTGKINVVDIKNVKPTSNATFAAVAIIILVKNPANIIGAIGIKNMPFSCCSS